MREEWRDRTLAAARAAPTHAYESQNHLFSYLCHDVALADGGVLFRDHPYIALGDELDGMWIVGTTTLRLLTYRLGLGPPTRRLLEESSAVLTAEQLAAWWTAKKADDPRLSERLTRMMSVRTSTDLRDFGAALLA